MKKTAEKKKMDCRKALSRGRGAFIAGGVFAIIGVFMLVAEFVQRGVSFMVVGVPMMIYGAVVYATRCVCPHCGKRFAEGYRMIAVVPEICPNCRREVYESDADDMLLPEEEEYDPELDELEEDELEDDVPELDEPAGSDEVPADE